MITCIVDSIELHFEGWRNQLIMYGNVIRHYDRTRAAGNSENSLIPVSRECRLN